MDTEHCWISKDELIDNILLWTPTHRHGSIGQPAKIYIHQLSVNTVCSQEDLLGVIIRGADGKSRGTLCCQHNLMIYIYIYIYIYIKLLATIVEGYPKAPLTLATILRWKFTKLFA